MEGGGRPRCPSSGVSTSQARHRHEARHLSLCRGGGLAVWPPSSSYLSCGRTPGGPPVRACTARAPFGHGRVVPPAFSLRCLPTLPRCPWGGVRIPLLSSSLSPLSSSLCSTPVAGMTQAQRKHRAWLQRLGGGFPFGAPISPWSGTSTAFHAGPCHPGLPPCAVVLVPVFSLSSPGAWFASFVVFFFCLHRSPPVSSPGTSVCPLSHPHVPSPPPCCPRPFPWWVGEKGVGAPSLSVLRRKHVASTAQAQGAALVPLQGRGACRVAPVVALPGLPSLPQCPPRWGLHGACFPWAWWCGPSRTLSPLHLHLAALSSGGGAAVRPSLPSPPTLGGAEVCVCGGGGGGLSSSLRRTQVAGTTQARRRHEARHPSLCRGGGGMPCGFRRRPPYPALAPPVVPPPGLARRVPYSGTVVWSVPHSLTAASLPCRVVLGGGVAFRPPPTRIPRFRGGGGGWEGEGRPCRLPFVARMSQARRRHNTSTGRGTWLLRGGGGGFPLGLPALLHGMGSAPQDHQPLLPLGGSRHVSAWCSVSRACSLLCPYLLEDVRNRVETDDEEVRAAGRTYRTPRRLLAPSAALVEGRAPVWAPNSPGGADCPSSPWCPCIHFRAP